MKRSHGIAVALALILSTHAEAALALPPILAPPPEPGWWSLLLGGMLGWPTAIWAPLGAIRGVRWARSARGRGRLTTGGVALARLLLRAERTTRATVICAVVAIIVIVAVATAVVSTGQKRVAPETPRAERA